MVRADNHDCIPESIPQRLFMMFSAIVIWVLSGILGAEIAARHNYWSGPKLWRPFAWLVGAVCGLPHLALSLFFVAVKYPHDKV